MATHEERCRTFTAQRRRDDAARSWPAPCGSVPRLPGDKNDAARFVLEFPEGADQVEETYKNIAPTEFAEAEQLLEVRVDDTTLMFVSLYADNDAMERASAARSKRMDINKDIIESMDGKTGNVILNHNN